MNNTSPIGQEYNYNYPRIEHSTYNLPFVNPLQKVIYGLEGELLDIAMRYYWVEDYCFTSRFKGIRGDDSNPYGFEEEDLKCPCASDDPEHECICDKLPSAGNRFDVVYDIYATKVFYMLSVLYYGTKEIMPNADKVKSKIGLYEQMEAIFYFKEYLQMHKCWFYHCMVQEKSYHSEFEDFVKWCYEFKFAGEEPFIKQKIILKED